MKVVNRPLFPGYVFCAFPLARKSQVLGCPGVSYIVAYGGVVGTLTEEQMKDIRRMVDAGAVASERLAVGQRVRITHGALAGIEGTLVREARGNKLVVSIEILNQAASLYIGEDHASVVVVGK